MRFPLPASRFPVPVLQVLVLVTVCLYQTARSKKKLRMQAGQRVSVSAGLALLRKLWEHRGVSKSKRLRSRPRHPDYQPANYISAEGERAVRVARLCSRQAARLFVSCPLRRLAEPARDRESARELREEGHVIRLIGPYMNTGQLGETTVCGHSVVQPSCRARA